MILPAAAWVAALAGLPGMGPSRLAALLARWTGEEAWRRVAAGDVIIGLGRDVAASVRVDERVVASWRAAAGTVDVGRGWDDLAAAGIGVLLPGQPGFPPVLAEDREPPAVLFHRGSMGSLAAPRVAVVGTRRCTHAGRVVARELGLDLAEAGVCVVSGLALGIDGAAHVGALAAAARERSPVAPPVGVVATGLDVAYPRRHAQLWRDVAAAGAVVSEYPLGTRPDRWRFPARNRLIAALADVLVVVESHAAGGSMHTVESALERDRTVMVVPGPVRSPASAGTNNLLAAGAAPVRDAGDVLVALGLDAASAGARRRRERPPPEGSAAAALDALGWEPATLEHVAERLGSALGRVAVDLSRLEREGWVVQRGSWFERVGE